jgi:hypothetical protein
MVIFIYEADLHAVTMIPGTIMVFSILKPAMKTLKQLVVSCSILVLMKVFIFENQWLR